MKTGAAIFSMLLASFAAAQALLAAQTDDPASKAVFEKAVAPYLKEHCFACHDAKKAKAGLRLDQLGTDFLAGKTADVWHEVIDKINIGDMPPEDVKRRPDAKASLAVTEWVRRELKNAEKTARMAGGRILSRRLNRDEYLNTVRDLLHLDTQFVGTLRDDLPGDGKAEGFDRLGSALLFDGTQLSTYIRLGARIAERAIVADETPPSGAKVRAELASRWQPRPLEEVIQNHPDTKIPGGPNAAERTGSGVTIVHAETHGRKGAEFGHLDSWYESAFLKTPVTNDAYYRIRVKAGAFRGERATPLRMRFTYLPNTPLQVVSEVEITAPPDQPAEFETVVFMRRPPADVKGRILLEWNGHTDCIVENPEMRKTVLDYRQASSRVDSLIAAKASAADIAAAKAEAQTATEAARAFAKRPDAVAKIFNPKYDIAKVPKLFVEWIEFEGPVENQWPPASHVALLPKGVSAEPVALREFFARLLPRAFRRPATQEEISGAVALVEKAKGKFQLSDVAALRYGLQSVLSSPEFLLLFEPSAPGTPKRAIADHELASRLSYFLWSTMPDDELLRVADSGKLHDMATLHEQVRRMIADSRARAFAENFAGQWLHVRDFATVTPAKDYRDYDTALRDAEAEEPIAFFEEVTRKNLSVLHFLDSDFTMANARLAKFYGIEGVSGAEFQRVALRPEQRRGGVLTMGGLLTYLADGTRTLPVRRGAWILEQIFNDPPPPPPPNAGEIQPNVQGKNLTLRQRLEQHRNEPTCASCHAKIDPLGLALENYDAIGAWRTKQNGEGFKNGNGPVIDASGKLPDGRTFATPEEFKRALLAEKERFARAFTQKVLTYALCRPVGYIDNETITRITDQLAKDEYRMHTLILGVVTSEPFLTK